MLFTGLGLEPAVDVYPEVLAFGTVPAGTEAPGTLTFIRDGGGTLLAVDVQDCGAAVDGELPDLRYRFDPYVLDLRVVPYDDAPCVGSVWLDFDVDALDRAIPILVNDAPPPERVDSDEDGVTVEGGDCDDIDPAVFPGAVELADGLDQDCDGRIDEGTSDLDGDGYSVDDGDCDDADWNTNPGAVDGWTDVDRDCDGRVELPESPPVPAAPDSGCDSSTGPSAPLAWIAAVPFCFVRPRRSTT